MSQSTIQNIQQETGPLNIISSGLLHIPFYTLHKLRNKLQNIKDSSLLGCQPCQVVYSYQQFEESNAFVTSVNYLPIYMTKHPRR